MSRRCATPHACLFALAAARPCALESSEPARTVARDGKRARGVAKRRDISHVGMLLIPDMQRPEEPLRDLIERRRSRDRRSNELYNLPVPTLGASIRSRGLRPALRSKN